MSTIGQEIGPVGTATDAAVLPRPAAERKIDRTLPRHLQKILALQDLEDKRSIHFYLPGNSNTIIFSRY